MRQLLVIKTGSTLPALAARRGDFEDWILVGMGLSRAQAWIVDVSMGETLPDWSQVGGVVITGSHAMVTHHLPWSEMTAAWLAEAEQQGLPVLGICYGHQLLAYALGGEVQDNPLGQEAGIVEVHFTGDAAADPLLHGLPNPAPLQLSHAQTVRRLPVGARRLAFSQRDENQAFVVGPRAWGVQFHPEFDAEVGRAYIEDECHLLEAQGQDPQALSIACVDYPYGSEILRRFANICQSGDPETKS